MLSYAIVAILVGPGAALALSGARLALGQGLLLFGLCSTVAMLCLEDGNPGG